MKNLRLFGYSLVIATILLITNFSSALGGPLSGRVPTLQGFTTDTLSMITIFRTPGEIYTYELNNNSAKSPLIKSASFEVGNGYKTDTLEVSGLTPNTDYEIVIKNSKGQIVDSRIFQSLDLSNLAAKVCVGSCARIGSLSKDDPTRPMFDQLFDQKPAAVIWTGDLIYGDDALQAVIKHFIKLRPKLPQITQRFIQAWSMERLYRQTRLTPFFNIWDDHDFGFDGADKTNPYAKEMLRLFRAYFPLPTDPSAVTRGPGVSYAFNLFGKRVLMLDNRSFLNFQQNALFGAEQLKWIEDQMRTQKEVVIATGMPVVNMGSGRESMETNANSEWNKFRDILRRSPAKAVFLTGDVHYSETRRIPINVLGYETYQFTASHLRSTSPQLTPPFKSGYRPNDPNQISHVSGKNFMIADMDKLFTAPEVTFFRGENQSPVHVKIPDITRRFSFTAEGMMVPYVDPMPESKIEIAETYRARHSAGNSCLNFY